ncbi:MAG: hypothetical protein GY834_05745 [Bacteroidetes bacterium]|nr:hypothetical protein [Bacteroidota bacterium]
MKNSNLFWGGILVALGVLFILNNLNLLDFNWWGIFRLWPMLLVLLGVTLLPIKNSIKIVLTLILLAITITLLITNTSFLHPRTYHSNWDWSDNNFTERSYDRGDQYFYEPYDKSVDEATLKMEAIAGKFVVVDKTSKLIEFEQDGNIGPYVLSSRKNNNHQSIDLSLKNARFRTRQLINDVEIKLNPDPIWNLYIESGAAKIDLDVAKFKTKNIDIEGGASSVYIKIGDLFSKTDVSIASGASAITIVIPEDSGCEISTETILSSKNFKEFTKLERGLYQTENFDDASNKVFINIEAAVTSLRVRRY